MSKARYIWDRSTMQLVDPATYYASKPRPQRSHLACPTIHSDFSDPILCHADGKRYSSKGAYRQALKDNNCIEVGTEKYGDKPRSEYEPVGLRDDIKRALWENGHSI
jgi:hypothetical protein